MIKLAFIITGLNRGGAEKMLLKILSTIDRTTFEPRVFCLTTHRSLQSDFIAAGIQVYTYQLNKPLSMLSDLWKFLRDCRQFKPHLIQGWMYHGNLLAWLAQLFCTAKLIFGIRACLYDFNFESFRTQCFIRLGGYLSSLTDGIIYVSDVARAQHEAAGYQSALNITIANGFELDRFSPNPQWRQEYREKLALKEQEIAIGFFARFHKLKGFHNLLEAFAYVHKKQPNTKLVLAGDQVVDQNSELMATIKHHHLEDSVILLGELPHPEHCLNALDLFVSPSLQEGFPNVVGEAMACGIPCVVTDVGDSALAVGDTGLIVPPNDCNALADALLSAIKEPRTLRQWGEQARLRIKTEFSLATIVKKYEAAYTTLLEKNG
ncbi:glycosyltransferase [Candidatus Odyssella thessalonicensis]|uniref:glycosyltransferase n=1 Tax=Candidatus Odyssella thessalonicensis TaxID=84647 RepID=UPI000225A8FB|nr:glycosyltransferase [Candidatus Odyssella thessalonicensis]